MKRALITGITGQDGSYLAELLLAKGYEVYGLVRRSSSFNTDRIDHLYRDPHETDVRLRLIYGDLNDASSLNTILRKVKPSEIYNLGAQSHVRVSFDVPEYTGEVTGLGTVRLLEAIRETELERSGRRALFGPRRTCVHEIQKPHSERRPDRVVDVARGDELHGAKSRRPTAPPRNISAITPSPCEHPRCHAS